MPDELQDLEARLDAKVESYGSVLVALSGGVDSGLVAAVAARVLGARAVAATAAAESLAAAELDQARRLAAEVGIAHHVVTYSELQDPTYAANPASRCFVCQGKRMAMLRELAARLGCAALVDGTNASDPGSDRPGLAAVRAAGVRSPLLELGIDKERVRALARRIGLSAWDRPANACLSSRVPHGQPVTLGKLRRVERAETLVAERGFRLVRVRHDADGARVEVAEHEVERLRGLWPELEPELASLGFARVALDPRGYRPGGADRQ